MAYTRGMPAARPLRAALSKVETLTQLEEIIAGHLEGVASHGEGDQPHAAPLPRASIEKLS
jgi:hypothetical protein